MTPDERITRLENLLFQILRSDRFIFAKDLQIQDGRDIQVGRSTGTKIGTGTDQKLGFFNATPVVRQSAVTTPTGGGGTASDAIDITARTAIGQIKTALSALGLTA